MTMPDILDFSERIRLALRIGESHYREFKSTWVGAPGQKTARPLKEILADVARTLVAFANADGGELLLGVEDDGSLTGVGYSTAELAQILEAPDTHVHKDTPLPAPRKAALDLDGKTIVYFYVSKGTQFVHLTSEGRCIRRVDRESLPFSSEGITARRLEDQSRTWDRETAYLATLEDLDFDLIQTVASQVAYGVSVEKFLQFLDLAEFTPEGLRLKKAATLLFAKDVRKWHSGCFVRIMTIKGKEKLTGEAFNVAKDATVADNILKLVDSAWERLTLALSSQPQFTETARFRQELMYPQIACREALINAIVHRNYAIEGRGIEVSVFQDRMEILSPGMLLSTISIDDIRQLKGVHESRNPSIARVLREVGFVRELGEGMRRIFNVMRSNALAEPLLESDTTGFTVTLYHKSLYDPNVKLWLSNFERHKLTESQVAVLALGYGGKEFSTQDIIDRLGIVNVDQVREILTPLRSLGLVERTRNSSQSNSYSRRMRIPKREVPTFRVVASDKAVAPAPPPSPRTSEVRPRPERAAIRQRANVPSVEPEADRMRESPEIELFVGNLNYNTTKQELVAFLRKHCDVVQAHIPSGHSTPNKGYAFVTIGYQGQVVEIVQKLDQQRLSGRTIHVRLTRRQAMQLVAP